MTPPFLVIGNPENRRVQLFCDTVVAAGEPPPLVLSHLELLRDPSRLAAIGSGPHWVRIESTGENADVERGLLRLGFDDAEAVGVGTITPASLDQHPMRHGEILCPRQLHFGFLKYLGRLAEVFARRPDWRVLSPPASIAELFDKRLTSRRWEKLGIPVPERLPDVDSPQDLRAAMAALGWRQVFVKLSCASSASCLAAYSAEGYLMTTIERTDDGWFNSLKVRRVDAPKGVDQILGFLLREGSIVERAVPKARLDGAYMDLRLVVIDGDPVFMVVRQNHHPITNLHLGGWRGDLASLRTVVPEESLAAALSSCRDVWAAHDCFHVGVDLLFEPGFAAHRVIEANAFGDLLPGLERDGLSVYGWQVQRLLDRSGSA